MSARIDRPTFRDKRTAQLARGEFVPAFSGFRTQAEKRLRILLQSDGLSELRSLNSNRLEALVGNRQGQYSVRINGQWRICFEWPEDSSEPFNIEIVDYH